MAACSIGILPDAEHTPAWPHIRSLLEPAVKRGDREMLRPHELVWVVLDGTEIIAAATTRLTKDDTAEVLFVGGRDHKRWLKPLDDTIAAWARDEGAKAVRAFGRKGWVRVLGWDVLGTDEGSTIYERRL